MIDILRVIFEGATKPTHIMYRANLAWDDLRSHLASLANAGLLVETVNGKRAAYQLTQKGIQVLRQYLEIKDEVMAGERVAILAVGSRRG